MNLLGTTTFDHHSPSDWYNYSEKVIKHHKKYQRLY